MIVQATHWPDKAKFPARFQAYYCYHEIVPDKRLAKHAGKFVKHVLPAAVKPVHSLWHEILSFIFLTIAAVVGWNVYRHAATWSPFKLAIVVPVVVVTAGYGISSFLKARRISRS